MLPSITSYNLGVIAPHDRGGTFVRSFNIDKQKLQVLKSFQPFYGNRGNGFLIVIENLKELLESDPARTFADNLGQFGLGEGHHSMDVVNEAESKPYNLLLAITLMFAADMSGVAQPENISSND
jgi:hypothetical protein